MEDGSNENGSSPDSTDSSGSSGSGSSSPGLLDYVGRLGSTAGSLYSAFGKTNAPPPARSVPTLTAAAQPASSSLTKYLPWGIGAVVLIAVLGFVFSRKK